MTEQFKDFCPIKNILMLLIVVGVRTLLYYKRVKGHPFIVVTLKEKKNEKS